MIKPDAVAAGYTGAIIANLEGAGFRIRAMHMLKITRRQAEEFYAEHRTKEFFGRLIDFIISGESVLLTVEREDAICELRRIIGHWDPAQAAEGTIRNMFGDQLFRNAIHASDSVSAAERELRFWSHRLMSATEARAALGAS